MKLFGELWVEFKKVVDKFVDNKKKYLTLLILLIVGVFAWIVLENPFNPYFKVKTLRNMPNGTPVYIGDYKLFFAGNYRKESDLNKGDDKITCASIYDIKKQKNIPLNSCMDVPRSNYLSILLPNNKVLILGGNNSRKTKELRMSDGRNAEIYDINTNKFRRIEDTRFEYDTFSSYITLQNEKVYIVEASHYEVFTPKTEKFNKNIKTIYKTVRYAGNSTEKLESNLPIIVKRALPINNTKILLIGDKYEKLSFLKMSASYIFNPISSCFEYIPNTPPSILAWSNAQLKNGNILFCGGAGNGGNPDCYLYDIIVKRYKQVASLNIGRKVPILIHIDDKVYIFGGQKGGPEFARQIRSIELYDPKTNKWKIIARSIRRFNGRPIKINEKTYLLNEKLLIVK